MKVKYSYTKDRSRFSSVRSCYFCNKSTLRWCEIDGKGQYFVCKKCEKEQNEEV